MLLQQKCEHCNQQTEEETKLNALRDIQHHDGKQRLSWCHTKATVMNMKLWFIRVLEVWPVTTLLWRIVSGPGKLLRQELEQKVLVRMTFPNGGHQG
jgi:hypothetical protein